MNKVSLIIILLLLSSVGFLKSQNLTWTGSAGNNDFFDEANWKDTSNEQPPANGTIDPGNSVNVNLEIFGEEKVINASGIIKFGTGSLVIKEANLKANGISGGKIILQNDAYLDLSDTAPLQGNSRVELKSPIAWLRFLNTSTNNVLTNYIDLFSVDEIPANYPENIRIDNYYFSGAVVRREEPTARPLTLYSEQSFAGNPATIAVNSIHSGNSIPGAMNDAVSSFVLKKGYMATFAVNDDGTGLSKVYIASETDLKIDKIPNQLNNQISFIRVIPWNWVTKKGIGGNVTGLNEGWNYAWNNSGNSTIAREYVPMSWGKGGADDDADIEIYRNKYKATHVLAFNESDNCNDQSGKWGNLCNTDVAVETYQNLMKTGLRLVSPSCRENAPFGWLKEFYDKATDQDIRIDIIGVHWYDWGSNPANSPNADPQNVFNRFKSYLQKVYDLYRLPIWITEFNANPNRTTAVNLEFMKLALPYLEELEYVERFAWFQPNSGVADYFDNQGNYTNVGNFYREFDSTPAVKAAAVLTPNNLDEKIISGNSDISYPDKNGKVYVFPNPLREKLNIYSYAEGGEILIYNMQGGIVLKEKYHPDMDVSELTPGIYFVKTSRHVLKFVKI